MADSSHKAGAQEAQGVAARRAAARALDGVLSERRRLEDGLESAPGFAAMEARDRAFARLIAATALRRLGQIDAALNTFLNREPPAPVMAILRCGAAELIFIGAPPHAAVASNVSVAGADRRTAKMKGLVNAVLRRVAERGAETANGLPPESNLPGWLREAWIRAYGAETARAIAAAGQAEPNLDLTAKTDPQAVAAQTGGVVLPTGTVRLPGGGRVDALPGFADGSWWVQDAASAVPARLLNAAPGERVLDLCAAPGGKAMQLAAAGASVTAVDASEARLKRVRENLARTGLSAETVEADLLKWAPGEPADAVLLDAPCTATGTLRRSPDAAWLRRAGDVAKLAALQARMLDRAAGWVRPGGRMVYCVCSLQPEEGEAQIAKFLDRQTDFRILPVQDAELPGLEAAIRKDGTVRILPSFWPDRGGLDGFFAARLERAPFRSGSNGTA